MFLWLLNWLWAGEIGDGQKKWGPPKSDGPSQEGQEIQAVRRYIRENQIQDYGSISGQLTDSLSTEPKA